MQPPVAGAGQRRAGRQLRAMQEEQQGDGGLGRMTRDNRSDAVHRRQRGQPDHADDRGDVGVDR